MRRPSHVRWPVGLPSSSPHQTFHSISAYAMSVVVQRYYRLLLAESPLTSDCLVRCCNGSGRCRDVLTNRRLSKGINAKTGRNLGELSEKRRGVWCRFHVGAAAFT